MKGKVLLAIVVVGMFVSVAISPAYVNASLTLYDIRNGNYEPVIRLSEDQIHKEKIQLTSKQIEELKEFIETIKSDYERKLIQHIVDEIITDKDELDIKALQKIAARFYNEVDYAVAPTIVPVVGYDGRHIEAKIVDDENVVDIPLLPLSGIEITVFKPINANTAHSFSPWDPDGYHWGATVGVATEKNNANAYSGCIGTLTNAWIGGAVAEGMQYARFYADQLEIVYVDAEIYYTGGGKTIGIAAFAGTYKSFSNWMPFRDNWENWQNNYHKSAIDSPWDPEDIIPIVISIVSMWASGVEKIAEAIENIDLIVNYYQLLSAMQDLVNANEAEIYHVIFGFIAEPGYHEVYAGLRSQASGCITGTGIGIAFGQVSKITVYEIPL